MVRRQLLDSLAINSHTLHLAVRMAWREVSAKQRLLLVIDQFEEIFTLRHNEKERCHFRRKNN